MAKRMLNYLRSKIRWKTIFQVLANVAIGLTIAFIWFGAYLFLVGYFDEEPSYETGGGMASGGDENYFAGEDCNVAGINLHGEVVTYDTEDFENSIVASSEDIITVISDADEAENIKGIMIDIDSYGGNPVAAQEIADALKRAKKPVVALIRGAGASAAYWVATGADAIVASNLSDVGGIGVTMSYLDFSGYNSKEGYVYNNLRTAPFKDYGDPEKPLTEEERALMMRDLMITHEAFVKAVADNRKLLVSAVEKMADGATVMGEMALKNKLIDRLGSYEDAEDYLKEKIDEEPKVCW